jgi:dipeptidyl aminopeptidase/acylaminoacyl peptidase
VGLNDRDPKFQDLYRINLVTGERQLVIQNDGSIGRWVADLAGDVRLAQSRTAEGGVELLKITPDGEFLPIYTCRLEETCQPLRFHRDGRRVYLVTNQGDNVDLSRLLLLDVETGATELVQADPKGAVDFGQALFSQATDELMATVYWGDRERIYAQTAAFGADLAWLQQQFADSDLRVISQSADDRLMLIEVYSDTNPGQVYQVDRSQQRLEKLYDLRPDLPVEHLAAMHPIRYVARDGLAIPAYLTLPQGLEPTQLPTIIMPPRRPLEP